MRHECPAWSPPEFAGGCGGKADPLDPRTRGPPPPDPGPPGGADPSLPDESKAFAVYVRGGEEPVLTLKGANPDEYYGAVAICGGGRFDDLEVRPVRGCPSCGELVIRRPSP